jgi:hypothetical protein
MQRIALAAIRNQILSDIRSSGNIVKTEATKRPCIGQITEGHLAHPAEAEGWRLVPGSTGYLSHRSSAMSIPAGRKRG